MNGVTLLLPARDEAGAIGAVLADARAALAGWPHELLVIDDGSTDATARLAAESGATVLSGGGRGYGAALVLGAQAARFPVLALCDADGSYPLAALPGLLAELPGRDMVVGWRQTTPESQSRARTAVKAALLGAFELATGLAVPDVNSGLRVVGRQAVLDRLALFPQRFSFTTTLTLSLLADGGRIHYVPVAYRPRVGRSKWRPLRDTALFGRALAIGAGRILRARARGEVTCGPAT